MRNSQAKFRTIILAAAAAALLGPAASALAKEMIVRVEACGDSECSVRAKDVVTNYEILSPATEPNREDAAPSRPSPGYTVRFFLRTHGAGLSRIVVRYQPLDGYLHVLGRRGGEPGGPPRVRVRRHWVELTPDEISSYDALTSGLTPVRFSIAAGASPSPEAGGAVAEIVAALLTSVNRML